MREYCDYIPIYIKGSYTYTSFCTKYKLDKKTFHEYAYLIKLDGLKQKSKGKEYLAEFIPIFFRNPMNYRSFAEVYGIPVKVWIEYASQLNLLSLKNRNKYYNEKDDKK